MSYDEQPDALKIEKLMKRCQVGVGGRNALDKAHDIMADCYGTLGAQQQEIDRLTAENVTLKELLMEIRPCLSRDGYREVVQCIDAILAGDGITAHLREKE